MAVVSLEAHAYTRAVAWLGTTNAGKPLVHVSGPESSRDETSERRGVLGTGRGESQAAAPRYLA